MQKLMIKAKFKTNMKKFNMFDIIVQEPTASAMDDAENNSQNVNAINQVENVSDASPDERPIGKIQLDINTYYTIKVLLTSYFQK